MSVFSRTLGSLTPQFTIRAYGVGIALFVFIAWIAFSSPGASHGEQEAIPYAALFYAFVNTLLFPFSKLVWNELRNLALGDNFVLINAFVMLIAKIFINLFLWCLAIFIAPMGLLYLWYRTRDVQAS